MRLPLFTVDKTRVKPIYERGYRSKLVDSFCSQSSSAMPPTKPTKTTNSAIAKLALTISDLSAALNLLIKRPLKDVQGVVRHEKEQLGRQARRKKGFSLLRLPMVIAVSLLSVLAKILLAPLELWAAVFQKKKFPRSLLLVMIPCCCLLIGWAGYSWFGFQQGREIGSLRSQATTAVTQRFPKKRSLAGPWPSRRQIKLIGPTSYYMNSHLAKEKIPAMLRLINLPRYHWCGLKSSLTALRSSNY